MKRTILLGIGLGLWLSAPSSAQAETYEIAAGDDVEAAIAMLQPGDELVLGGGMYTVTERFTIDLAATEEQPIVIRAQDGEVPHIHRPNANENIVDIVNGQWVTLDGIEWSGGSAGIRISSTNNLTISNCDIHDTNDVALRANDGGALYENLHIVGNEIHDTNNTGEGMYLGCNGNGCQVANSVIERNWVHHTNGPTINQGDGIELKEGSYGNVIRDNVIHDTNYPCILTYSTVGNGEPNVIEGNAMWNCGDHAIQSAADAVIRNNVIVGAAASGIGMQPHQSGAPANLTVVHNTIVVPGGRAINVSGPTGAVVIANNAVYSEAGPAIRVAGDNGMITVVGNVGVGGTEGTSAEGLAVGALDADFVAANYSGTVPNDVFPAAGALLGAADPAYATPSDFNGLPSSDPADVGAYAYDAEGNPGWTLQPGFKEFPEDDGGDTDGSGSGGETGDDSDSAGDATGDDGSADTGDGDGSTGGGIDPSGDDGGVSGSGGASSSGADADADNGGGGCRVGGQAPALALLVMVGLWIRRRPGA